MGRIVRRPGVLFVVLAVAAGAAFWAGTDEADWWAFVDDTERGPWPKFKFGWPEQLIVSATVGALVAAPAALALSVARWAWSGCRT